MKKFNRFAKGSAVYTCKCCGHRTRDTGEGGAMVGACDLCYDLSGFENSLMDGFQNGWSKATMETIINNIQELKAKGANYRIWDTLLLAVINVCEERMLAQEAMDDVNYVGHPTHY